MELLTAAEIARRLALPESTTRYYARRFRAYVPAVGVGRARRYRVEAVDVLRMVADNMRANVPSDQIEQILRECFPVNALEPQPQQQATVTQQPSATIDLTGVADALRPVLAELLMPLAEELTAVRAEQLRLNTDVADLLAEVRLLREHLQLAQLESAELHQVTPPPIAVPRRPWWQFWKLAYRRPPPM